MKNLAKCTPSEFVNQTAKIREAVAGWIEAIDLMKIRAEQPAYRIIPKDATPEVKVALIKANAEIQKKSAVDKLNRILDNMLTKHPQETLEVLALCCFVDPAEVDSHTIDEYMDCVMDMIESESVMRFFRLLARLDQTSTSKVSKA